MTVNVDGEPNSPQAEQTFSTTVMGIARVGSLGRMQEQWVVVRVVVRVVRPVEQRST